MPKAQHAISLLSVEAMPGRGQFDAYGDGRPYIEFKVQGLETGADANEVLGDALLDARNIAGNQVTLLGDWDHPQGDKNNLGFSARVDSVRAAKSLGDALIRSLPPSPHGIGNGATIDTFLGREPITRLSGGTEYEGTAAIEKFLALQQSYASGGGVAVTPRGGKAELG